MLIIEQAGAAIGLDAQVVCPYHPMGMPAGNDRNATIAIFPVCGPVASVFLPLVIVDPGSGFFKALTHDQLSIETSINFVVNVFYTSAKHGIGDGVPDVGCIDGDMIWGCTLCRCFEIMLLPALIEGYAHGDAVPVVHFGFPETV